MVTIIIIEGDSAVARKKLKDAMPKSVRESLDAVGKDVDMDDAKTIRDKLPEGFPREFVVPEEVLFFPDEEDDEPPETKKRRRRMKELNTKLRRKGVAGNAEEA